MSKTLKNKAASMALFATMMAVGTLPLAAQAPSDYFLEASGSQSQGSITQSDAQRDMNVRQVTVNGTTFEKETSEE